jgi:transcriptional regulator with XRE-family HTH domain
MIDLQSVGEKITRLRQSAGLSQDALADQLFVSRQAISAWEVGKSAPSIDNVIELAKIFGVSFEDILCLNDKEPIDPSKPFEGHSRDYVLRAVIRGEAKVDLPSFFYFCTGEERLALLEAIRRGDLPCPLAKLQNVLTSEERSFLIAKGGRKP